jgi:hypothetical protein
MGAAGLESRGWNPPTPLIESTGSHTGLAPLPKGGSEKLALW